MRIKPHSFLGRDNVKRHSGHFIYFKHLVLFVIIFTFLSTLHVYTSLCKDLKILSSGLIEKSFVGYLKVYEVFVD